MADELEYQPVMWGEMKPDIYAGESCDNVETRWWVYGDGDMDGDYVGRNVSFDSSMFPPGTKITVSQPCCPKCHQIAEMCISYEGCNFDWDHWRECKYS